MAESRTCYEGAFFNTAYVESRYASVVSIPGAYRKTNDDSGSGVSSSKNGSLRIIIPTGKDSEKNGTDLNGNKLATLNGDVENKRSAEPQRANWGNDIEFLMSCIAMSVGLGNVWRFPFTALDNGGGAFVIPYIIVLFLVGKPVYYMEMLLGQFSSRGSVKVFDFAPIMRGVGYGQALATSIVTTYYATLMALTLRYFIDSFSPTLPWSFCREDWSDTCIDSKLKTPDYVQQSSQGVKTTSAEFYFIKIILREKDNIDDGIGYPNWSLAIALAVAWIIVVIILIKGVKSSGKASYFLAIFPYCIMLILLIRSLTLPGALNGVLYFLRPQWDKLLDAKVWYAAVTQVFFSLAICFGNIIMYASYNRFEQNIKRDCDIITSLDTFTSLLSGIIIFGILGNLAYESNTSDIRKVFKGGPGLAFISYPDAIAKFKFLPQVFSVLFFLMLFVLGIGSNVGMTSCVLTVLKDRFANIKNGTLVVCIAVVCYCLGLLYITPGGQYILNLLDFYGASFVALVLAIFEMLAVGWVYACTNQTDHEAQLFAILLINPVHTIWQSLYIVKWSQGRHCLMLSQFAPFIADFGSVKQFCKDVHFMLGIKTSIYYRLCWSIITPLVMVAILIYTLVNYEPLQYNGYSYKSGVYIFGWCLSAFGTGQLLIWAVYAVYMRPEINIRERFLNAFKPKPDWGPLDPNALKVYKICMDDSKVEQMFKKNGFWHKVYDNVFG